MNSKYKAYNLGMMTAKHEFTYLKARSFNALRREICHFAQKNRYGLLCPAQLITQDNKEIPINQPCQINARGKVEGLHQWIATLQRNDDFLKLFLPPVTYKEKKQNQLLNHDSTNGAYIKRIIIEFEGGKTINICTDKDVEVGQMDTLKRIIADL